MEIKEDGRLKAKLTAKSKYKQRKNTPDHRYVVDAVMHHAGEKLRRQTSDDWGNVLRACFLEKVPPNADAARQWIVTPEDVNGDGKPLSGYMKARAVVERDPEGQPKSPAVVQRSEKMAAKKEQRWKQFVGPKLEEPLGNMPLDPRLAGMNGRFVLALVRIEDDQATVLDVPVTDEAEVQRISLKMVDQDSEPTPAERPVGGRSEEEEP